MSITYPVFLPVSIKSDRFGLNINKAQFSGEFARNRIAQSHGAGTTDRWEGVYTTPFLGPDQHREMSALLTAMSVDDGTFFAFNPNGRSLIGNHDGANLLGTDAEAEQSATGSFVHEYLSATTTIRSLGKNIGDMIEIKSQVKSTTGADTLRIEIKFFGLDSATISSVVGNSVTSSSFLETAIALTTIPKETIFIQILVRNLTTAETGFTKEAILSSGGNFVSYLKVDGASQTGTTINIKDGAVSTNGLLRAGTMLQIETAIYEVAERVDTNGSGLATVEIRPAIRAAHPDGEPILVKNPVMIAQLVQTDHPQETGVRSTGVISFAWQEVV